MPDEEKTLKEENKDLSAGYRSPYTVTEGMTVRRTPGNSTAGAKQVYRLFRRGELWPASISLMNILFEFGFLTSELIDRAFLSIRPDDEGFADLPVLSSGKRKSPYRSITEKLFTYGIVSRYAVLEKTRRWYVYRLSEGAREWLLAMNRSGGVVRHPLYCADGNKTFFSAVGDTLPPEGLMRALSLSQAAISIRSSYPGLDVKLGKAGGTMAVTVRSADPEKALIIHRADASDEGVLETAGFFQALGDEAGKGLWGSGSPVSVAVLTDGEAAAGDILHPGLLKNARNAYLGIGVMYLFDFMTFYYDRPLDSLHFYPGEDAKVFELRSWT
ncbi:MAG: hypothetical protein IJT00_01195 [Lachnospiraceae bacterium]|nr:hypothetical protein [Lachnospiraceae bacterium]